MTFAAAQFANFVLSFNGFSGHDFIVHPIFEIAIHVFVVSISNSQKSSLSSGNADDFPLLSSFRLACKVVNVAGCSFNGVSKLTKKDLIKLIQQKSRKMGRVLWEAV